jgi:hypothetical protein
MNGRMNGVRASATGTKKERKPSTAKKTERRRFTGTLLG